MLAGIRPAMIILRASAPPALLKATSFGRQASDLSHLAACCTRWKGRPAQLSTPRSTAFSPCFPPQSPRAVLTLRSMSFELAVTATLSVPVPVAVAVDMVVGLGLGLAVAVAVLV